MGSSNSCPTYPTTASFQAYVNNLGTHRPTIYLGVIATTRQFHKKSIKALEKGGKHYKNNRNVHYGIGLGNWYMHELKPDESVKLRGHIGPTTLQYDYQDGKFFLAGQKAVPEPSGPAALGNKDTYRKTGHFRYSARRSCT